VLAPCGRCGPTPARLPPRAPDPAPGSAKPRPASGVAAPAWGASSARAAVPRCALPIARDPAPRLARRSEPPRATPP